MFLIALLSASSTFGMNELGADLSYFEPTYTDTFATDPNTPYVAYMDPAPGETDVPIDTDIYVEILCDSGIDLSSILLTVNGEEVSPEISPIAGGVALFYDPPEDFDYLQEVTITIDACAQSDAQADPGMDITLFDPAKEDTMSTEPEEGCMETMIYSFTTEPPPNAAPKILLGGYGDSYVTSEEGGIFTINALVSDPYGEDDIASVRLFYQGLPTPILLYDDGEHGDFRAGDNIYGYQLEIPPGMPEGNYLFEIVAYDEDGNESDVWPYLTVKDNDFSAPPKIPSLDELVFDYLYGESEGEPPVILYAGFNDTEISTEEGGHFSVLAWVEDNDNMVTEVQVYFGMIPTGIFLYDDGEHGDFNAGDHIYGQTFDIQPGAPAGQYLLTILATDETGNVSDPWPYFKVH